MMPSEISSQEFQHFKDKYQVSHVTGDLTPTVCEMFGIRKPAQCGGVAIAEVVDQAYRLMGGEGRAQKILVFCPDAVGDIHARRYPEWLQRVQDVAGFKIPSVTMMPSVTPVCFGTIFSGASPQVHGIQKYEKPLLTVETLFDVLAEAGKNVAILSINECSIDTIFRKRNVDYFSFRTDEQIFQMTQRILADSDYDFIVSYMMDYDHMSHLKGPWAPESLEQLHLAVERFEKLVKAVDTHWSKYNRAIIFAPDHGNHQVDAETGGHGADIPDDMIVNHFYRIRGAQ